MVAATWSGNSSCTANFAWGTIVATTLGKPAKASIFVRDLGGVSAPYTTMIGSLTCCAAMRNASRVAIGSSSPATKRRALLARFVLDHRLADRDPFAPDDDAFERPAIDLVLGDGDVAPAEAMRLLEG